VDPILSPDYGRPFELFGPAHILTMLAMALVGFVAIRAGKQGDESLRRRLRWWMVAVFVFWMIEWQVWHLVTDLWTVRRQLPLHMCGIMIWVAVYGLATQDRRVFPLIYFFGIAGSMQAVLTPDTLFDFPHIRFFNTLVSHGLLVIAGLWIVAVEGFRPTWRDLLVSIIVLNVYAAAVYLVNVAIGANYLFVVDKPATASLLDFFPDWPWYLPILEVIVIVVLTAMCWPFNRGGRDDVLQSVPAPGD
jgi:hypothetical integral membrane protein (TIGR02206 family)